MCGRFTLRTPLKDVVEVFNLEPLPIERAARYNIAPTQSILAVRHNPQTNRRELADLHWGLVPPWADDPTIGNRMINARSETVATRSAFREPLRQRRCLIPSDGFFEWQRQNGAKQPYYIRLREEGVFAFAGLWDRWQRADQVLESCTILTTEANELLRPLHERMPVIIDRADYDLWLDPAVSDPKLLEPLFASYPAEWMLTYPVNSVVNSARQDVPQCIEPAAPRKQQGSLFD